MYGFANTIHRVLQLSASGGGVVYLYDNFPATAGFSIRKLNSFYTGPAIRVRRSSDSSEDNFYFDSNGEISLNSDNGSGVTLGTFVGANTGYVVTWYNQSSALHATQSTALNQPTIIESGVLNTFNGKAAIKFIASGTFLQASVTLTQPHSGFAVGTTSTPNDNRVLVNNDGINAGRIFAHATNNYLITAGTALVHPVTISSNTQYLFYSMFNSTASELDYNTEAVQTGNAGTNNVSSFIRIGAQSSSTRPWDGYIQEVVLYDSNESANKVSIKDNINLFFTIY